MMTENSLRVSKIAHTKIRWSRFQRWPEGLRQSPTAKHHSEIPGQLLSSDNTRQMNAGQRVNHFRKEFDDAAKTSQSLAEKDERRPGFEARARCKLLRVKRSGLRRGIWGMSRRAGGGRTDNVFTASYARCIPLGLAGYTASYAWRSRTTTSSRVNSSATNNPSLRPGNVDFFCEWRIIEFGILSSVVDTTLQSALI